MVSTEKAMNRVWTLGSQHGHQGQEEDQRGEGEQAVGEQADQRVDPAPVVSGEQAKVVPTTNPMAVHPTPTSSETRAPHISRSR